jgi:predicted metal-dependent enzyme (double-stranded beta helix superfamily)
MSMSQIERRRQKINETVNAIRSSLDGQEITQDLLSIAAQKLTELATASDLFSFEDFPPPTKDDPRRSCLYRLSEDKDHRFALYANVADGEVNAPPHDHTTWAVIVGFQGQEENRFYEKASHGVSQTGSKIVEKLTAVTLLADDLHSIHIKKGAPVLNFHMYGIALEQLPGRNYWSDANGEWRTFPAHTDIRDAR